MSKRGTGADSEEAHTQRKLEERRRWKRTRKILRREYKKIDYNKLKAE